MNAYSIQFYDLLSRALGGSDSKRIQGFLDNVMALKYNKLEIPGFSFDEMQLDFAYEQIQREISIAPMANYYDLDSPAIPDAPDSLKSWTGKIPRMKKVEYLNEDKIRKQLILEQRIGYVGEDRVVKGALDTLFVTVDKLIAGHTNSLTFQRHQMVSRGKFSITYANNPKGLNGLEFSAHVPDANKTTLTGTAKWWTSTTHATEGNAANPVKDLSDMVAAANNAGLTAVHFEIEKTYLKAILGHSAVLSKIALYMWPNSSATADAAAVLPYDKKVEILGDLAGAPIVAIDSLVGVEAPVKATADFKKKNFNAFEKDVVVLVPDGEIGKVLTVEPIAIAGGNYGSFYDGRLLLTVGVDPVQKCQSLNTEMTSLVVPEVPQYMWYLFPNNS